MKTYTLDPAAGSATVPTTQLDGLPGSFFLHFQTQHRLSDGAVTGCEALLRWNHPAFGVLSPYNTLATTRWAERLPDLDRWVMVEACRQSAEWDLNDTPMTIAVNVDRQRLESDALIEDLIDALVATGAIPSGLMLDIPSLAGASNAVHDRLARVRALGVGVALDLGEAAGGFAGDVFTHVKIPISTALVQGRTAVHPRTLDTVARAHEIGAIAVAKGIETVEGLDQAIDAGFDEGFGHLYSAPRVSLDAWTAAA